MNDKISPKYQMDLIENIEKELWKQYSSYKKVEYYIIKWYEHDYNSYYENFV